MSVPEKILLAIRGIAHRAAAPHPGLQPPGRDQRHPQPQDDRQARSSIIAGIRNVTDEILRFIGSRREWLKNYSIMLTLVKNPRTPLAIAINLLGRAQQRDLKKLAERPQRRRDPPPPGQADARAGCAESRRPPLTPDMAWQARPLRGLARAPATRPPTRSARPTTARPGAPPRPLHRPAEKRRPRSASRP